ncbi:GntR family transcriptional regulator [Corynebacterium sp.]|uniref:GntR family transcriptional regulator n=1 Tax=Corynebacterium sp. TaxID=1720 RepID=UPI0026DC142A|nr:GntR family transcriptional regulator [Corynebacterium sp.]MDO5032896.1 GntR family transcriptional regulator [Corynebacterium sp.]
MTTPRRPAYLVIADALRSKIENKQLSPGDRFPTERELVREFGVARMTVRHALDVLQAEGLIDRKRGRTGGTFVRAVPPTLNLSNRDGILLQLRRLGLGSRVELLSLETRAALPHLAAILGVAEDAEVWEIKGVHHIDGRPAVLSRYVLPVALLPELNEEDLQQPVLSLLERRGRRSVFQRETIAAACARAEEQKLLDVGRSQPLLRLTRLFKGEDGTVLAYAEETLRPDAATVEVSLGTDPSPPSEG